MSFPAIRKVAVVGVGAIGGIFAGWLGSRLDPGAVDLSVLARGKTLATLQMQGLTWVDAHGADHHVAHSVLHCSDSAVELGPQDLVIVSVKAPSIPLVAQQLCPLLREHTAVLIAMNGVPWWFFDGLPGTNSGLELQSVDPGGLTRAALPTRHVLGCVVHATASVPRYGRIESIKNNQLILGEPSGGISARAQAVARLLEDAGFAVKVSERIQEDIWFKLWGNMTMNPVSALTRAPCDHIFDDPLVRSFCSAVMLEAQAIGEHIGCAIHQSPEDRHAITRAMGSFKTSMLQDVEAGRPIELDALVGVVREIAQHIGLATPNIDALLGLTRLMGRSQQLYPQ